MRRDDGRCVGAATRTCNGSNDVNLAEATGLREVLRFVESNQLSNIIIELDAQSIVATSYARIFPRSNWGRILRNCSRVLDSLDNVSVS
ncbi:hypothetical protein A2U01_0067147 [Trifolium medium]|uniref:RNase H type-1 domain-containing protein n=1 Tax=Trifolium medium TaxID=97028 RepID=A0A392SAN8_9FABA|nr:hypothetical protein [Trifolium medium]